MLAALLIALPLALIFLLFNTLWHSYVLSTIWGWFMVPIFGLPSLSLPQAIGVSIVFSLFTGTYRLQPIKVEDPKDETQGMKLFRAAATPFMTGLCTLALGYFVKSFL